jgi:hypothetical protein
MAPFLSRAKSTQHTSRQLPRRRQLLLDATYPEKSFASAADAQETGYRAPK